ncbi:MAG: GNAT family N-acetyltransferase [Pseudodonghicola sp.]|nr:GNAT family N-acetyltransferase [Pseudodonghicola sp.]
MSIHLRPARPLDASAMGDILYSFQVEVHKAPRMWSGAETIAYCGEMIENDWVTMAEMAGRVVGFLARDGAEVCALYVVPDLRGAGLGQILLDAAKQGRDRLWLKVMEYNSGAQRFYRRNGFAETARSDGAENDENLPDITMLWQREGT